MKLPFRLIGVLSFFITGYMACVVSVNAQNRPVTGDGTQPRLGRNPLVLNISARVLEAENIVIWYNTESKYTMPGRPVDIKLVGSNIIVAVQFTPFIRRGTNVLVAQGQIWIEDAEKGISYYTSIQTIPMEFGEPIHFFPLGANQTPDSLIEIIVTVNPHNNINEE